MRRAKTLTGIVVALALLPTLSSCTPDSTPEVDAWWEAQLDLIRARAEEHGATFPLDVIADGEITAAEWQESVQRVNDCIVAIGHGSNGGWRFDTSVQPDGSFQHGLGMGQLAMEDAAGNLIRDDLGQLMFSKDPDAVFELQWGCVRSYDSGIVQAVLDRADRHALPPEQRPQAQVECLIRRGLVPETFSVLDLQALQAEQAMPETYEQALDDPRLIGVHRIADGEWAASWNPDWVLESQVLPGAPDLERDFLAANCIHRPNDDAMADLQFSLTQPAVVETPVFDPNDAGQTPVSQANSCQGSFRRSLPDDPAIDDCGPISSDWRAFSCPRDGEEWVEIPVADPSFWIGDAAAHQIAAGGIELVVREWEFIGVIDGVTYLTATLRAAGQCDPVMKISGATGWRSGTPILRHDVWAHLDPEIDFEPSALGRRLQAMLEQG